MAASKKVVLSDMLGQLSLDDDKPADDAAAASTPEPAAQDAAEPAPAPVVETPPVEPAARKRRQPKKSIPAEPNYLEFERKEARIRPDQYQALTELSRSLNRVRRGRGQRITENTLIRVAVDLLLERSRRELSGTDEAELRKSVGL